MYSLCLDYKDDAVTALICRSAGRASHVSSSAYNAWKLVSLSPCRGGVVLVALGIVAGVALAAGRDARAEPPPPASLGAAIAAGAAVCSRRRAGHPAAPGARVKNRVASSWTGRVDGLPASPAGVAERRRPTPARVARISRRSRTGQHRGVRVRSGARATSPTARRRAAARGGRTCSRRCARSRREAPGEEALRRADVLDGADNVELGGGLTGARRARSRTWTSRVPFASRGGAQGRRIEQVKVTTSRSCGTP